MLIHFDYDSLKFWLLPYLHNQKKKQFQNLFVTYVGMFSSGDFVFQWLNFIGINIR